MKRQAKEIFLICLVIAVLGQVHFYPFNTDFRITFGVVMFPFMLMYFYAVPIIYCSTATAISVWVFRVCIDIFANGIDYTYAIYKHFPAFMYYISYGLIIYKFNFRKYIDRPIYFLVLLSSADILSNIFELLIRSQLGRDGIENVISTLIFTAFIRSAITFFMFWIIRYYNILIIKDEHQRKYNELLVLAAKLKSETLFLKKSMQDIENAMQKSYSINSILNSGDKLDEVVIKQISDDSLSLAIEIHEIKKDYNRIVLSMEKLIPAYDSSSSMNVNELCDTVYAIFSRYLEAKNLEIDLIFEIKDSIGIYEYYAVISILNNLIQNSIEAANPDNSFIRVRGYVKDDKLIFEVSDNGKGISDKDRPLIFKPGYTTKYNPNTGFLSTGLGLTHVKLLVEYLNGEIHLIDNELSETTFKISIPLYSLTSRNRR